MLYRLGCQKCQSLEPVFMSLATEKENLPFQFFMAEVENVPNYTKGLKKRLMGLNPTKGEVS